MTKLVAKYTPLKKVTSGFLAAATVYLAHRYLNLDLGSENFREAVESGVGLAVAFAVSDPRVKPLVDAAEKAVEVAESVAAADSAPAA